MTIMMASSSSSLFLISAVLALGVVLIAAGGSGATATGFTALTLSAGTSSIHEGRAVAVGPSGEQFWGDYFQGGSVTYGSKTATSASAQALGIWKRVAGTVTNVWTFACTSASGEIDLVKLLVDSTGTLRVVARLNGAVAISPSLVLSSAVNIFSILTIDITSAGVVTAQVSTNAAGNVIARGAFLEANNAMAIVGFGTGATTLAGQTLALGTNTGFYFRLSAAGAGVASQKSASYTIIDGCYNSANSRSYVVGSAGGNFFVSGLDAAANWQGAYVSAFAGVAGSNTFASALSAVCLGSALRLSGEFRTDVGATLQLGSVGRASTNANTKDTFTVALDTAALGVQTSNQGFALFGGSGQALVATPAGVAWGSGDLFAGAGTFSGTVTPTYAGGTTKFDTYVTSISAGSVYGNVSVADVSATGSGSRFRDMAIGGAGNGKILFAYDVTGTVSYGTLSASVKSGQKTAILEYTL